MNAQINMFDVQPSDPYQIDDICAAKHKGNKESVEANKRVAPKKAPARQLVHDTLRQRGPMTCKEVARLLGKPMHWISGRITELKGMSLVEETGAVRDGGRVVRAILA